MSFLDILKNIFNNGKKNATLIPKPLVKKYGQSDKFEVALYENTIPLVDKEVIINVNGNDYTRKTDENGIARLNINLSPGEYTPLVSFSDDEYNLVTAFSNIIVQSETRMEGIDLNKVFGDKTPYQCAVYSNAGRVAGIVDITVNGRSYRRTPDASGLYKLNINLNPGTYKINARFIGDKIYVPSEINNVITIREPPAPEPTPEPVKLYPYITTQGGGKLGQKCGYSCGPHSLMQAIYRLTGIELSESELMSVCGTTTAGTGHDGLATGLAWFNRKYGYNLKMTWKNFSDIGWEELQRLMNTGAVFFHLLYRNQWGHYEVARTNTLEVLNSLGSYCSYPAYCGYIENRSRSTQQSYISGISQKSVCIITR